MARKKKSRYSGIGGQAVLEGVMMKNGEKYAVAVRKPNGEIEIDVENHQGLLHGNKIKELPFIRGVFNFIDSKNGRWSSIEGEEVVETMGMKWVPILNTNFMMPTDMEEFKLMADGPSMVNSFVMREGIVLRDPTNDFSFKNVSREYLMKHNG